jgi:hypothetical protein
MTEQDHNILDEFLDATYAPRHIDQGSEEWEQIRAGRFTSSEWWKLMECGKRPMTEEELKARPKSGKGSKTTLVPDVTKMGDRGVKYIRKKVWETLTGRPFPEAYAYNFVYGKETEPLAVEFFEKKFGVTCEQVGFQPYTDHAGGSPDRLIGDKEGLEIKCPSGDEQIDYLMLNDHFDLKRNYPEIYWQCVTLLLFTNRELWHLCTYDPRMVLDKHKLTHIKIYAKDVEEDIEQISVVLEAAVKEKLQLIQLLS